mmetsp:Transcript_15530/g.44046  ORF Transcript_15530/g.44046 Transcript_15530/m.44046 type:complete len:598 (+) Transcript_15530:1-1794(+)
MVMVVVVYVVVMRGRPQLPRGYTGAPLQEPVHHPDDEETARDNFASKKVPANLDAIVIGSGMGGLMTAALLAKVGKRVLVLEQHYIAGGTTHSFEDKGFEFDTGLHYVGDAKKYGGLINVVADKKVEWAPMGTEENGYVYDEIVVGKGDHRVAFDYRAGKDTLIRDLCEKFPGEETAIRKYFDLVQEVNKISGPFFETKLLPSWLRSLILRFTAKRYFELAQRSAVEILDELTDNAALKAVLCAQFGDAGGVPSDISFLIQAGVSAHYFRGGNYPVGGTQVISRAIIPTIERAGGRVLVRAPVEEILVDENRRVRGVRMEKGMVIQAPLVISAAGAHTTANKLLSNAVLPHTRLNHLPQRTEQSVAHIIAFVGLRGTNEELGLRSSNIWHLPCGDDFDLSAMVRRYYENPEDGPMLAFLGSPSAKDRSWNERYPGKATVCILTEARYEWFADWEGTTLKKRGEAYRDKKQHFLDRLLEVLFDYYPKCRDRVEYIDCSSPLSSAFYLGAPRGASYGLAPSKERFTSLGGDLVPKVAGVEGLYLSGQDVATAGVAGAIMGGVLCAFSILGYPALSDLVLNRNLITDIMYLDKLRKEKQA